MRTSDVLREIREAFEQALRHHVAGQIEPAIAGYRNVLALKPDHGDAHNNLGVALLGQGRTPDAVQHYQRAIALNPGRADARYNLGIAYTALGRTEDATREYRRALRLKPDYAEVHNNLGTILADSGKMSEAALHYGRAISLRPAYPEAHFNRAEIRTFRRGDAELEALEALACRSDLPPHQASYIHFALGKALDDCGEYKRAFEHWKRANTLKRRATRYNEPATHQFFERIADTFDGSAMSRLGNAGDPSPLSVFIVGMPRSGTTLIEQILASHPAIQGAGELTDLEKAAAEVLRARGCNAPFPGYMKALDGDTLRSMGQVYLRRLPALDAGKIRIVNKLPDNFLRIGLIRMMLPNARIIHVQRDPLDTCVSCFSKLFANGHGYSYDLSELGRYYRQYSKLMRHWRSVVPEESMLDVHYEDVVGDLEGQARRLVEYCGLAWDDRCLNFHNTKRQVRTASAAQVRRPLFSSSVGRWKRYESGLIPLMSALGDLISDHRLEVAA